MKKNVLFIVILIISCNAKRPDQGEAPFQVKNKSQATTKNDLTAPDTELLEIFTDSLHIGEPGKSKIELIKHRVLDDTYVIVKFYTKGPAYWYLQNTYLYDCNTLMGLEPYIADFNNDSFKDITFISATAARGANEVRRLFIYDADEKKLVSIVNAEDYPNMRYNKELDCIDAFLVYGGTSTVFARIEGDSLKEFASVHNDQYRTVYEIDKSGKERQLSKDSITDPGDIYLRYINYKPLKTYEE